MSDKQWKVVALVLFILLILSLVASLPGDTIPNKIQPQQFKKTDNFQIIKIDGRLVYYTDLEGYIQTKSIRDHDFFIMESNNTYLQRTTYGGLSDFYQWILFIKR